MNEDAVKLDSMVKTYLTIRDERERLVREHDMKDRELANDLAQIEQVLLSSCNDINADSIRTSVGTIIKTTRENFVCSDWDNFKSYVMDNEAIELLQQRIHQANFKEFLNGREEEGLPPGISTMREFKITVRKPSSK
jgi:hypothetical protein|tara:strand:- start:1442 stop:1852 length:411 start_codon:yes stop_codon:yes gene_type:complete